MAPDKVDWAPPFCYHSHRAPSPDGAGNLTGNLVGGHNPKKAYSLRHLSINKSGTDVSNIYWQFAFASLLTESLGVVHLKGLGSSIGWRTGFAALTSHGAYYGKMTLALLHKTIKHLINKTSPSDNIGVERRKLPRKLQLRIKFAHSGTDHGNIYAFHVLPSLIKPYGR